MLYLYLRLLVCVVFLNVSLCTIIEITRYSNSRSRSSDTNRIDQLFEPDISLNPKNRRAKMEARYDAASPYVPTYKMQIARDKDGIWITVSKSGILPRCASTMGNVRDGERNVARSRLRVRADLDETCGGLRSTPLEKKRERETILNAAHTKSPLPLVRAGALAGADTAGGFR